MSEIRTIFKNNFVQIFSKKISDRSSKSPEHILIKELDSIIIIIFLDNKLVTIKEFKHGINSEIITLPSGHIERNESVVNAARRELIEETGLVARKFSVLGKIIDNPNRNMHFVFVVLAEQIDHHSSLLKNLNKLINTKNKARLKRRFIKSSDIAALSIANVV